ncbi:hypothetical protein P7K49_031089 [Saguinus oedipus]|uniref:Uncharacterized protein n=1 Tax=Saguinus oedipus TaxID=9490 RepID=A0ABQ9U408_SAGOE|nr:hypothetical protein P7K49_031089 [Saguinus oedipus]
MCSQGNFKSHGGDTSKAGKLQKTEKRVTLKFACLRRTSALLHLSGLLNSDATQRHLELNLGVTCRSAGQKRVLEKMQKKLAELQWKGQAGELAACQLHSQLQGSAMSCSWDDTCGGEKSFLKTI